MMKKTLVPVPNHTKLIMLRVGEVFLKGRNQSRFVDIMRENLLASLRKRIGNCKIKGARGHLFLHLESSDQLGDALEVCANTPGFTSFSPILRVQADPDIIAAATLELAIETWSGLDVSFAAKCKRVDKMNRIASPQMNLHVAEAILTKLPMRVDLGNPDVAMHVSYGVEYAHIWVQSIDGIGGMPVGGTGKALLLLSGGIDSPVAGYLAQKRGCRLQSIYFHSPPFISEASREKVEVLGRNLAERQNGMNLHVVPFTDIQKAIKAKCDPRLSVLLYRRFMYRIAVRVAELNGCTVLCTGENLAQVASQTLENLHLVDMVTNMMTLRPLITYDKREIVDLARLINTFDTSILPYDDCCTLFVPRHPTTRGKAHVLEKAEAALDVEGLIQAAVEGVDTVAL
jgi:thiamine biosynthesis protein ThiI